jgi:hypothetical protein
LSRLKEDKIPYSKPRTVWGNLGILFWILLGTIAIWFYNPTVAYFFLFFAFIMVYVVIRTRLCKTCGYCKVCTMGTHKLPELVFGKAELGGLTSSTLLGLLTVLYVVLTVIPITFLLVSVSQEYAAIKIAVLLILLLTSAIGIIAKRKREFMKFQ